MEVTKEVEASVGVAALFIVPFVLSLAGVVAHNLSKMNTINRRNNGRFDYWQYVSLEKFSIAMSVLIAIIYAYSKYIEGTQAGVIESVGYMQQSLLVKWFGKSEKDEEIKD